MPRKEGGKKKDPHRNKTSGPGRFIPHLGINLLFAPPVLGRGKEKGEKRRSAGWKERMAKNGPTCCSLVALATMGSTLAERREGGKKPPPCAKGRGSLDPIHRVISHLKSVSRAYQREEEKKTPAQEKEKEHLLYGADRHANSTLLPPLLNGIQSDGKEKKEKKKSRRKGGESGAVGVAFFSGLAI